METTPSITFDIAFAAMIDDRAMVQWKTWNESNMIGQAIITRGARQVSVDFNILNGGGVFGIGLDLDELPDSGKRHNWAVMCPKCCNISARLFLVKQNLWCKSCHSLIYTSQTMTSAERWAENYRQLQVEMTRPRRFGEHYSTFMKRRAAAEKKVAAIEKSPMARDLGRRPTPAIRTFYAPNGAGPWRSA